jgi:DNA-binding HxlR family transcriptional regulator
MSQLRVSKTRLVSNSALNRALNAMGDRASLMVVEEAFLGASRYEEFLARTGCARSTLSTRLSRLIEAEILEKRPLRPGGAPTAYHLTRQGLALFDSMMLMWSWGVRWGVSSDHSPNGFVHQTCGQSMLAELRCGQCNDPLSLRSCSYVSGDACHERVPAHRLHRRKMTPETAASMELIDLLGDRWTGLTISAQYFGIHRFDAIQSFLGIASNILADRLRTLEMAGLFKRIPCETSPARHEYRLTDKGKDLYPHALATMSWADTWFASPTGPPVHIKHACGAPIDARTVCGVCHGELSIDNVTISDARRA